MSTSPTTNVIDETPTSKTSTEPTISSNKAEMKEIKAKEDMPKLSSIPKHPEFTTSTKPGQRHSYVPSILNMFSGKATKTQTHDKVVSGRGMGGKDGEVKGEDSKGKNAEYLEGEGDDWFVVKSYAQILAEKEQAAEKKRV
jgi:hypothetical protein